MTRLSTLDWCVFSIWVSLLTLSFAEIEYFPQNTNATWIDARSHCQACFKDLVTVTPKNAQSVVQNTFSHYWIGLRKRPLNGSVNSSLYSFNDTSMFWSRWANGEPLTFQNWYPGHPVFKSPYPRQDCCSCSCTCPARPTTLTPSVTNNPTVTTQNAAYTIAINNVTSTQNVTNNPTVTTQNATYTTASTTTPYTPLESECVKTPVQVPDVPDPDENYIEDPCVAMLSFGAWVEKDCWESLPFICYEERFYGQVNITNIKSASASLTWEKGPGNISHYRVEVNGSNNAQNVTESTYQLSNLTSGTFYSVKVFPVKCGRDLNPENGSFYTVPENVLDLQVVNQTDTCVSLNWTKPSGSVDLYRVNTSAEGSTTNSVTEQKTVCNLIPGRLHNFSVQSGVKDLSSWSEPSTVSAYTKPATVSNLQTNDITDTTLTLTWQQPTGDATGYLVEYYYWENGTQVFDKTVNVTELEITELPAGTKITLSVTALANVSLRGDSVTIVNYTNPRSVTNLTLSPGTDMISAAWQYPEGALSFTAELYLNNELMNTTTVENQTSITFKNLKNSAEYTVSVYSVSGSLTSTKVNASEFTFPQPPTNVSFANKNKTSLTFTWNPPQNTETTSYLVTLNSSFWGQSWQKKSSGTTCTFSNLTSGTNYTFQVQTISGSTKNNVSEAVMCSSFTEPTKQEITLSMMCSSGQSLLCDDQGTRDQAFQELKLKFKELLGDHVFWELNPLESPNTGN